MIATWPNACSQGQTAGLNMAGGQDKNQGLNSNICGFLGNTVASVGITKPENDDFEERGHPEILPKDCIESWSGIKKTNWSVPS